MKKNNWVISEGDMGYWSGDLYFNNKENIVEEMAEYIEKTIESLKEQFKVTQLEYPLLFITKEPKKVEVERIIIKDLSDISKEVIKSINEIKGKYKYDFIRPSDIELKGLTKINKYDDLGNIVTSWESGLIELNFLSNYDSEMHDYSFSIYTYSDIWFPVTNDWIDNKELSELNNPILSQIIKEVEVAINLNVSSFGSSAGWDDYPYATINEHGFKITDYNTIDWKKYHYANHRRKMNELEQKEEK